MRQHTWLLLLVGALAGSLVTGAAAVTGAASAFWRPFASGTDNHPSFALASASGGVTRPRILAVRVSRRAKVDWLLSCEGTIPNASANTPVVVNVGASTRCLFTANASSPTGGKLTLQLVRR
jgi:hypothetical protein